MAYGQWGNLAGYIYGTAVLYSLNPPDTRTPEEINRKIQAEKEKQGNDEDEDTNTESKTDAEVDDDDKDDGDEEDKPNDSAD